MGEIGESTIVSNFTRAGGVVEKVHRDGTVARVALVRVYILERDVLAGYGKAPTRRFHDSPSRVHYGSRNEGSRCESSENCDNGRYLEQHGEPQERNRCQAGWLVTCYL